MRLLDMKVMDLSCRSKGFLYSLIGFESLLVTLVHGDPQS